MSQGEELLAVYLRSQGVVFDREYRFHPDRMWRFDFAIPVEKLAIEVEGYRWRRIQGVNIFQSRHTSPEGFEKDCEKYNTAALLGWRVVRLSSRSIERGDAFEMLDQFLPIAQDGITKQMTRK